MRWFVATLNYECQQVPTTHTHFARRRRQPGISQWISAVTFAQFKGDSGTAALGWLGKSSRRIWSSARKEMDKYPNRFMILVVDFDEQVNRRAEIVQTIPEHIRDRVFIVGAWSNPQKLRDALGMNMESIGIALSKDCVEGTSETWGSELLAHNAEELARMTEKLKPVLFPQI